jgi:hypothetical protein
MRGPRTRLWHPFGRETSIADVAKSEMAGIHENLTMPALIPIEIVFHICYEPPSEGHVYDRFARARATHSKLRRYLALDTCTGASVFEYSLAQPDSTARF